MNARQTYHGVSSPAGEGKTSVFNESAIFGKVAAVDPGADRMSASGSAQAEKE